MATEKRLIDADLFRKEIECCDIETSNDWMTIVEQLNEAPTVDAVEVVHGEWTIIEDDYDDATILECSVCETSFRFDEYDGLLPQAQTYHYCPNCGARMDGDGND